MPVTEPGREAGRLAFAVLLGAAIIRIVAAVIAGFITLAQHDELNVGRLRVGEVLNAFGSAGESIGAMLVAAAAALVWWLSRRAAVSRGEVALLRAVILVTAAMAVARVAAFIVLDIDNGRIAGELAIVVGFAAADLLLCAGSLLVLSRLHADAAPQDSDQIEPLLFAVDRGNGEVFAFFSFAQARRTISPYSVEEDEYAFYTDEGNVVTASVDGTGTTFSATEDERREDLLRALRQFAQAKDLTVEEPQEPTSYAVPIADWQWLELWPGWMRPIGRGVRRFQA